MQHQAFIWQTVATVANNWLPKMQHQALKLQSLQRFTTKSYNSSKQYVLCSKNGSWVPCCLLQQSPWCQVEDNQTCTVWTQCIHSTGIRVLTVDTKIHVHRQTCSTIICKLPVTSVHYITCKHTHIRFTALWTLSGITRVSRYQNQSGFYRSKRQ